MCLIPDGGELWLRFCSFDCRTTIPSYELSSNSPYSYCRQKYMFGDKQFKHCRQNMRTMSEAKPSRIKDQRVDIKLSPESYTRLTGVKDLLEQIEKKKFSMQDVILLLCDWSVPKMNEMRKLRAKLDKLVAKKGRQTVFK